MKARSGGKSVVKENHLRDVVGRSGVYPSSGPHPKTDAPIRRQMEWGQGERGAAGYEDHGSSEMSYQGGALLGGLDEEWAAIFGENAGQATEGREVPLDSWALFCDWFTRHYAGIATTIMITDGQPEFAVAARELPLVKISANVMENEVGAITVQLDRTPTDYRRNLTGVKRVTYSTRSNGLPKEIKIERARSTVVLSFDVAA
jgi:hypothetical protein